MKKIGIQGIKGSFHHMAAQEFFPNGANLIDGYNGLLAQVKDTKSMSTNIIRLLKNDTLRKNLIKKHSLQGVNKPKRTPNHPTKSHMVLAQEGHTLKLIRFGQQGVKTAGKPKAGELAKQKARRKSFKARHGKNIKKGKMSAAYWANKVKW